MNCGNQSTMQTIDHAAPAMKNGRKPQENRGGPEYLGRRSSDEGTDEEGDPADMDLLSNLIGWRASWAGHGSGSRA
jgi:hypothetical protein